MTNEQLRASRVAFFKRMIEALNKQISWYEEQIKKDS